MLSLASPSTGFMEDLCPNLGTSLQVFVLSGTVLFPLLYFVTVPYYDIVYGGCYGFFLRARYTYMVTR